VPPLGPPTSADPHLWLIDFFQPRIHFHFHPLHGPSCYCITVFASDALALTLIGQQQGQRRPTRQCSPCAPSTHCLLHGLEHRHLTPLNRQAVCYGHVPRMHAVRCGAGALLVHLVAPAWPMQGDTESRLRI
jgi:hypothetical protein